MRDLAEILARLRLLQSTDAPAWLVTIARVEGSSYRREGTRLLVEPDGRLTGVLSGGCLERDVAGLAAATSTPRTLVYDLTADEEAIWGTGTGCAGRVTLLVEPLDPPRRQAEIDVLVTVLETRHEIRRATVFQLEEAAPGARGEPAASVGDRCVLSIEGMTGRHPLAPGARETSRPLEVDAALRSGATAEGPSRDATHAPLSSLPFYGPFFLSPEGKTSLAALDSIEPGEARATPLGDAWILIESILPPIHLLVVGAERDAPPLARLARELGWPVTVVDLHPTDAAAARLSGVARYVGCAPREIAARAEISPRTAVLLATHRYLDDLAALEALREAPAGHLALLGPVRRRERLLADLDRRIPGASESLGARLRSPAGLDLGGRAPEEVALAVVAEVQAAFAGRDARPLSDRSGSREPEPVEARP